MMPVSFITFAALSVSSTVNTSFAVTIYSFLACSCQQRSMHSEPQELNNSYTFYAAQIRQHSNIFKAHKHILNGKHGSTLTYVYLQVFEMKPQPCPAASAALLSICCTCHCLFLSILPTATASRQFSQIPPVSAMF
jgi:hypothetical protein